LAEPQSILQAHPFINLGLHWANVGILFATALVPFATLAVFYGVTSEATGMDSFLLLGGRWV
jgi:p-aminobenzoyl-glutamate transporter AbgT